MRIVTWNCYQGTDRKVPALLAAFNPDIAIVPESSRSPAVAPDRRDGPGIPHLWTGDYPTKGLGIYAPSAQRLELLAPASAGPGRHGLAARAVLPTGSVTVLGVWTVPLAGGRWRTPYLNALDAVLADYEALLDSGKVWSRSPAAVISPYRGASAALPVSMRALRA